MAEETKDESDAPADETSEPAAKDDGGSEPTKKDPLPSPPPKGGREESAKSSKTARAGKGSRAGVAKAIAARRVPAGRGMTSSTRNIIMFVGLVVGLAVAFAVCGTRTGGGGPEGQPSWKEGSTHNVEITVVTPDYKNLSCAMSGEVEGYHCAYESQTEKHAQGGDVRSDDKVLQPYTTTDRVQFLAAGLWTQPAVKAKLDKENFDRPGPRFSVNCKFTVAGKSRSAHVQWKPGEGWYPGNGWYVGNVSDCKMGTVQKNN